MDEAHDALRDHLEDFFQGHQVDCLPGVAGPIEERIPGFRIFRIGPGPRFGDWTYVTSGCAGTGSADGHDLEFVLTARTDDWQHLESVTMNAYYHAGPPHQRLDHGHVVPINRPWFADSACDRYLSSLPYPFGPDFEVCTWDGGHARILWLLPITPAERDLIMNAGLEAFESLFEEKQVDYTDPHRPSVT
ncbi:suppressor of fused domain protein [Streptosporangium longisporum]|uniref:suppressor of fused domain protein n=1 Tax=Streptosporangium longisporum TaxID=46187 RepID=UPI0031F0FFDD